MYSLKILDSKSFERVITMLDVIDSVEEAYRLYSKGDAGLFPIIIHEFEQGLNDTDIKSGHLSGAGFYGLKLLGYNANNPKVGLQALSGLVVLMDIEKQQPLGIVDASKVTYMRTGAAGAIGAKILSREDSKVAVIVGAGSQGRAQLLGLSLARPNLETVYIVDLKIDNAEKMINEVKDEYKSMNFKAGTIEDLEVFLKETDILVTCTTSRKGFVKSEWIKPGTHINAIGADMPGKQELDPAIFSGGKVFADSIDQVVKKGETQWAIEGQLISRNSISEIGSVLNGNVTGRESDDQITIFDATGMALQDLITAKLALEKAELLNLHTSVIMES